MVDFTSRERHTILAALRFYVQSGMDVLPSTPIRAALCFYQQAGMGEVANRSDEIHAIATNGGNDSGMDSAGIDALCEKLNS